MVQISSLLAGCAILITVYTAPLVVPLGNTGLSVSLSSDRETISIDGKTFSLNGAASCSGKGGKKEPGGGKKGGAAAAPTNAKAVYFLTNAAENSVVALKVAADGTLSDGSITATGGAGLVGVDAKGSPAVPDGLFSQGAVKVAGNVGTLTLSLSN